MLFNWNPSKAKSNFKKHGVTFEDAATVFESELSDTFDDPDHSIEEQRFIIIGYSKRGKLLFVSHTDDGDTTRIISARELTPNERKQYEEGF
jgi:uncharacterized protein